EASAMTPPAPPAAPTELAATASTATQIALAWKDNSDNETGFEVERKSGTGAYARVATVGANVITYTDSGLTAATSYTYRVRAINTGGASAYSNESTATTQASSALSLDKDIQPIFSANCSCHMGASATLGMDLSRGNAYKNIVNVDSISVPSKKRVKPGDPANSFLYEKISSDSPAAGDRMPPGRQLLQADIDKIRMWIEQ